MKDGDKALGVRYKIGQLLHEDSNDFMGYGIIIEIGPQTDVSGKQRSHLTSDDCHIIVNRLLEVMHNKGWLDKNDFVRNHDTMTIQ